MRGLERRVERLERARDPEANDSLAWCCVRHAEHDALDDLPARCPHGRRFLVILTDNEASRRYRARREHGSRDAYRFTIAIDGAGHGDGDDDAAGAA